MISSEIDTCSLLFLKDITIFCSRLDILANCDQHQISIHQNLSLGVVQPETNQILKIEDVAIVSWLAKHFGFFSDSPCNRIMVRPWSTMV